MKLAIIIFIVSYVLIQSCFFLIGYGECDIASKEHIITNEYIDIYRCPQLKTMCIALATKDNDGIMNTTVYDICVNDYSKAKVLNCYSYSGKFRFKIIYNKIKEIDDETYIDSKYKVGDLYNCFSDGTAVITFQYPLNLLYLCIIAMCVYEKGRLDTEVRYRNKMTV